MQILHTQRSFLARALAVLALMLCVGLALAVQVPASPRPRAVAGAPPVNPVKPEQDHRKAEEHPFYAGYLKDPASLGFAPDQSLFLTIYSQVKRQHFEDDPDAKLFAGVAKEVERLLKEAKLSAAALAGIKRDRAMPEAIARRYGTRVDRRVLYYAMIRGMLEGTGDPYTVLMTPREYHRLLEDVQTETFSGIGIFIELDREHDNQLTIVEPIEGTPAGKAGLQPGDQIVRIDGKPTAHMSLDIAITHIRGQDGSTVVLGIRRKDTPGIRDYAIRRAQIESVSVTHKMLASKVGLIRLRVFGARTGAELTEAVHRLEAEGARALILDVRNNGGGYINAAIDVCSNFVKPGSLGTYVTDKHATRSDYNARARVETSLPVVLLVNGYSASASEITAGCLKDYGSAVIIGTKTFGKGSVQQLYPLPSGAALKITIAHFFSPKGGEINKKGVQPDIPVEMDARLVGRADRDLQMQKALEYLRGRGVIQ